MLNSAFSHAASMEKSSNSPPMSYHDAMPRHDEEEEAQHREREREQREREREEENEENFASQLVKQEMTEEESPMETQQREEEEAAQHPASPMSHFRHYSGMDEDRPRSRSSLPPSPISQPPPPPVSHAVQHVPTSTLGMPPPLQLLHEAHMRQGPPLEG